MKKLFNLFALLLIVGTMSVSAQNLKFGHINAQEVFNLMPEKKVAEDSLVNLQKSYAEELEIMQVEANKKYEDYMKNRPNLTSAVRQAREEELSSLQQRITKFNMDAEKDLGATRNALLEPISKKLKEAIEKVGKNNGFIYIFDKNTLHFASDKSIDVIDLVKKELNIK